MLNQPTIERLQVMKLHGMAEAFQEQIETADSSQLSFEERFGLLVDRQWTWKEGRALTRRLQLAKFKERGVIEDVNYQHPRGLDRKLMRTLATSEWVRLHHNVLLVGQTGIGKTRLACALAHNTSQLPIAHWHEQVGDPTIADSIMDRLVHNAYRIELSGESMRKQRAANQIRSCHPPNPRKRNNAAPSIAAPQPFASHTISLDSCRSIRQHETAQLC